MNVSNTGIKDGSLGDAWDDALLASEENTLKNLSGSMRKTTVVFDGVSDFDFRPDQNSSILSVETTPKFAVKPVVPITRLSLIPTITKSKVPSLPIGHALVPLSGIMVAVGLLLMVQVIIPAGSITATSYSLVTDRLSSLVFEPIVVINERVTEKLLVTNFLLQEKVATFISIINPIINQPVTEITVRQSNSSYLVAATGSIIPVVELIVSRFGQILSSLWDALVYYKDLAVTNWLNFWYGKPDITNPSLNEAALRSQIKAEVLAELRGDLAPLLSATNPSITQTTSGQGLVVVPQSKVGDTEDAVTKIKGLFSDPVLVDFDSTGQSGVITPLFGNITGENYIFVLTPIASQ